ncbi:hypothetical protein ABB37_06684 [Leptomonas pyrrhocoris]|uniref:Uncharacterized protein n=1 Tax=Leptomonas pyrrhocoris TaxID=157538 RepID=A0A0N0DTT7_LEPPY|nr:hypothetical protein ABB37_06684 [Leptomonas pyrrhocoris]XP_015656337.1 hypothetical protein ABB37_06684 [Leptomonas pyrrhocoris]KPA77897.1 hypothetical protein ABB37_06684 [Leptomonas pyrrhocoris]KPA77898.1 hypothetical protein ABB37_06684 [Leptomonas pyrrhocoris]|eukprot:XP_015656336.1 hypothetical protein ABB37_06684 [Leptomonas pyrrhocoris]
MPAIETPFVMELHPGEELKLARTPAAENGTSESSTRDTNAFAKNDFQAWVSSICFVEEIEAETDNTTTATVEKTAPSQKNSVVRVSLVAHLLPQAESKLNRKRDRDAADAATVSPSPLLKTVTLASCNFSASTSAIAADASTPSTAGTELAGSVVFHSPLAFTSEGSIENLSVVAENMETTAGSSGSSGSVKRYQGSRRFVVRLQGLQQTTLTKEQVLLLATQ